MRKVLSSILRRGPSSTTTTPTTTSLTSAHGRFFGNEAENFDNIKKLKDHANISLHRKPRIVVLGSGKQ